MPRSPIVIAKKHTLILIFFAASLLTVAGLLYYQKVSAAVLSPRSLKLSNTAANASGTRYDLEIGITTPGTLGSLRLQFCANTSLIDDPCDPPPGFEASSVTLDSQEGATGFTVHSSSTANEIVLSRAPAFAVAGLASYTLGGVHNPSDVATVFVRVLTYAASDGSGLYNDAGGLAFTLSADVHVSAEVPPFLLFCAGVSVSGYNCATAEGDFIDFGSLGPDRTGTGNSQLVAATNAESGYAIRVAGSALASGTNTIEPMANQLSLMGQSQFGLNVRANLQPQTGRDIEGPGSAQPTASYGVANRYSFGSGEVVAASTAADDYRKYTVSYIVNVPKDQPGGVYAATMTYICLANF